MDAREKAIDRVTLVGSAVNALLTVFKFVAGVAGRSAAMTADAVHSLSDLLTDAAVLVFVHLSSKPADEKHEYGHGKFETLATSLIGLALIAVAGGILYRSGSALRAWLHGADLPRPGTLALWAALVSILLKELTYRYTVRQGRKLNSPALEANAWHHRSDALSSIGALVGIGGAILLGDRWTVLDPLASLVIAVFIIRVAWKLLRQSFGDLTEAALPESVEKEIRQIILSDPDVSDLHNLRTRRIGNTYAIEFHIRMDGNLSLTEAHSRTQHIETVIKERFGADTHVTVHVEPVKPFPRI
jgi:cation diffusion facilitator family transporter